MKTSKPVKIAGAILLGLVVIVILFFLLFDWNMLRPYINRKVSETTGREFAIRGDLDVKFQRNQDSEEGWRRWVPHPRVSAEDVHMSNPDWSTVGPEMASAQRVEGAFRILPLLGKNAILTDLRLVAPNVAVERRKDGRNSWTFKDNGPSEWKVDIQRLSFNSGQLRYVDEPIGLDLRAQAKSIEGAPAPRDGVQPYGLAFTLDGTYNKAKISGGGRAGAVLSLTDEHTTFPIEAKADIGDNKIGLQGTIRDPRSIAGFELQMQLGGASMADLYALTGVLLPETPPYSTSGHLMGKKNGEYWSFTYRDFKGKVGASDIGGTLTYAQRATRPLLIGNVASQQLRLADLGPTVGADTGTGTKAAGKVKAPAEGKALPVDQFNTEKWGALDAEVKFSGKRIVRTHDIPLSDIETTIRMKDKVLTLTPLSFGMAGGRITSNIRLDGTDKTLDASARIAARGLKIRELFPKLQSMQASFGEVNGDGALAGRGNSVAAMLGTSQGELNAVVTEGTVSRFILELAGLNVANAVFVKIFGDKQTLLHCVAAQTTVRNGRANIDRFVLDSEEAVVNATGYVDLAKEQLDVDVRPRTKGTRVLSLRTPLYARGSFTDPKVGPHVGPLALKGGAAVALAAVTPVAALIPLINVDRAPDTNCGAEIAAATKKPSMKPAPKVGDAAPASTAGKTNAAAPAKSGNKGELHPKAATVQ
ncbi:AsmA family protein [Massilia sp.]|uniref:AsmA family protein n=1 Tax=Massilia sp. TaxID=1882437 RepID=UPI0028A2B129|nr:AsmA family protein [Massilia sp.]